MADKVRLTKAKHDRIIRLTEQGLKRREIVEQVGLALNVVAKVQCAAGVNRSKRSVVEADQRIVAAWLEDGRSRRSR